MNKPYYTLISKDPSRNLVYVACPDLIRPNLGRIYREVRRASRPWRIIFNDVTGKDYELVLARSFWPLGKGWDRRSNPEVKLEPWHGVAWDALKGNQ
jgi:hypothetical protein